MSRSFSRFVRTGAATALALVLASAIAPVARAGADQIVVLSSNDLKGKFKPCGCHVPKGGLSRIASFRDSVAVQYGRPLVVENGGWFPETPDDQDVALFTMDTFHRMDIDGVGVSERDLSYGPSFLVVNAKRTRLPVTSANVIDRATGKPLLPPYLMRTLGKAKIGIFSLTAQGQDLGLAKDSVTISDPTEAAKATVAELKKQGATIIVLLTQLGNVASEDLVSEVDGIDLAVFGRDIPTLNKGRLIKNTVTSLSGDQGQYVGRTLITLDATGHAATLDNESYILSPVVGEDTQILALQNAFDEAHNLLMQRRSHAKGDADSLKTTASK